MGKDRTSIVFSGDVGFDKYMDKKWEDKDLISQSVMDFFRDADHVCLNVEGAIYEEKDDKTRGEFFHSMSPKAINIFKMVCADIWNIGNNHIMDAGVDGLLSTIKFAKENDAKVVGAGINNIEASRPVYIDEAGGIGIISVTYMNGCVPATSKEAGILRWDDMDCIKTRIAEIKKKCRWCVVISHGGEEFTAMPSVYTRERYINYLEFGADVVVGHHPHVPENYELFENGKAVFYSLGNFIFDTDYQRAHLYTDTGVLLKLIFTKDKMEFRAIGTRIVRGKEHIDIAPLPDIFENINREEFDILTPLAAKSFISEEKRRIIFLRPDDFKNATEDMWNRYFFSDEPEGFVPNEHMDFSCIVPYAIEWEKGGWNRSRLDKVKEYIQKLI